MHFLSQLKPTQMPKHTPRHLKVAVSFFFSPTLGLETKRKQKLKYCYCSAERVQREIEAVLEPSHVISYEDRKRLPYTNAVIHETLRYSNITSVGVPRLCVRNTTLLGFHIKKVRSTYVSKLWTVHIYYV